MLADTGCGCVWREVDDELEPGRTYLSLVRLCPARRALVDPPTSSPARWHSRRR